LGYRRSRMVMRYRVPAEGAEIEIEALVFWQEKDRMLKISIPVLLTQACCVGQVAYGVEEFVPDGRERVAQKWLALQSPARDRALTLINDRTYGFDFKDGELRLSLLRSPAYAGHPVDDVTPIVRQDRFEARLDQGDHKFTFWMNFGPAQDRLRLVSAEAQFRNEPYMALCASPSGAGRNPGPGIRLSNPAIQLGACKQSEDGAHIILRFFETTGRDQTTGVAIPALGLDLAIALAGHELKSFAINPATRAVHEIDLLERPTDRL
jgi:alpha-mannosidase